MANPLSIPLANDIYHIVCMRIWESTPVILYLGFTTLYSQADSTWGV